VAVGDREAFDLMAIPFERTGRLSIGSSEIPDFSLRLAVKADCSTILHFIRELAAYEKLSHELVATEDRLRQTLFGERPAAEVVFGQSGDQVIGFALYFQTYSTFLAQPGIYLEDLFVDPAWRGRGCGRALLIHLARLAVERGCGRLEWSVLDWNGPAIRFYRSLGADPMDEWTVNRVTGTALRELAERG